MLLVPYLRDPIITMASIKHSSIHPVSFACAHQRRIHKTFICSRHVIYILTFFLEPLAQISHNRYIHTQTDERATLQIGENTLTAEKISLSVDIVMLCALHAIALRKKLFSGGDL